jgi:hypothetical protein
MRDSDGSEVLAPRGESAEVGDCEATGRRLESEVTPGLTASLGQAEGALVPGGAGVEITDVQLEVGQPVVQCPPYRTVGAASVPRSLVTRTIFPRVCR